MYPECQSQGQHRQAFIWRLAEADKGDAAGKTQPGTKRHGIRVEERVRGEQRGRQTAPRSALYSSPDSSFINEKAILIKEVSICELY